SHIGHTYLDGLVGTSGRIEPDEGTRADLIEPYEPVRADSEVIDERPLACRWEFPSVDGGTVKDANDAAVARVVPHSARGVGRHGIQACIVRRQAPPKPLPRGSATRLSPRVGDSQPTIGWNGGHRKTNEWVRRRQPDPDGAIRRRDKPTDSVQLAVSAGQESGMPPCAMRGYGTIVELAFGPRYSVVHDSSTRCAHWSRNALLHLFERTVPTASYLVSVYTADHYAC